MVNLVAQVGVTMVMVPFIVRALGDRLYGFWTLVGAFIGYYGMLDFGLSVAVGRYVAKALGSEDTEECNRVFNTTLLIFSLLGVAALLVTGVLAGLAPLFCRSASDAVLFRNVILILGLSAALTFPFKSFSGVLAARLRFDIETGLNMISLALRTAGTVYVLAMGYKLFALAGVVFLSGLPAKLLLVVFAKKNLPSLALGKRYVRRATARELVSFSAFTFVAQTADRLRFEIDALVITIFIGLAAVTHYKIASVLIHYFRLLMIAALGVMFPVFSRQFGARDTNGLRRSLFFSTRVSVVLSTFIAFGFIVWGRPFIVRWMGPDYLDAFPCLVILVVGCLFDLWQVPSPGLLISMGRHRFYAAYCILEGVANLALSLLLVQRFGLVGVAAGTAIPMIVVRLGIQPVHTCRVLGISVRDYFFRLARTVLSALTALAIPGLITWRFAAPTYGSLLAVGTSSLAAYVLVLWLVEFSRVETRTLLQSLVPACRASSTS
jgi:O-antigen/teichoic acid export membrane protein